MFIRFFPVLLGIDLPAEARELAIKKGIVKRRGASGTKAKALPIIRAYRVESKEGVNKTVEQRRAELGLQITPLRIRRDHKFLDPTPETILQKGDIISIIGRLKDHQEIQALIGQEVLD